ncbi:MAG: efflux RND transporter periplasmic adaptor subunit [Vicinamibacteria bacterium]|nr:efflux RND transporter periplasmic adaptor subunit [Vicinamibacteria bacterium]
MKKLALVVSALALVLAGYVAGARRADAPEGAATKMDRKVAFYRSPMDPSIHADRPTQDSMGMDFIPVYQDEVEAPASDVPGRAVVVIPADRRQLLGVRSEVLTKAPLSRSIRTVGRIVPDERRLHHVHTRYDGFVEHVYVDFIGKFVNRGDRLLSIYSPELFATQEEYLLALRGAGRLSGNQSDAAVRGRALVDAVRQRLLLWDIRPAEIEKLERDGVPRRDLDLYSDVSGYVIAKQAEHGMRVTPADSLFDIVDLSHLWVLADVYEADLSSIRLGMSAVIETPSAPGRKLRGQVTFISPTVEASTRTTKVRIEIDNPGGLLKPDMFADVSLHVDLGSVIVVPQDAVIDAGDRKLAFVDIGEGRYEPRELTLGAKATSGYVVISGLSEGERVVVAANFLIDSESSLRAAVQAMKAPSSPPL